jgi:nucleotide-binding universal stress UspA family protein
MYRSILVAYDGSKSGDEALRQAGELGCLCRSKVHLVAIINPAEAALAIEGLTFMSDGEKNRIERLLQEGAGWLRRRGLTATTETRIGSPAAEIESIAREMKADLIVLGHRTRSALARWLAGSVGVSVLNHAPCSVLIAIETPRNEQQDRSNLIPLRRHRPHLHAVPD